MSFVNWVKEVFGDVKEPYRCAPWYDKNED